MRKTDEKTVTLDRFRVQRQQQAPSASGELTRVLDRMGVVAKIISSHIRRAALEGLIGKTGQSNVHGKPQRDRSLSRPSRKGATPALRLYLRTGGGSPPR